MAAVLQEFPATKLVVRRAGIRDRMAAAGIPTNRHLARAAGLHPTQFSRVLSGHSVPGNKFMAGMVKVFGFDALGDILEMVDDEAAA